MSLRLCSTTICISHCLAVCHEQKGNVPLKSSLDVYESAKRETMSQAELTNVNLSALAGDHLIKIKKGAGRCGRGTVSGGYRRPAAHGFRLATPFFESEWQKAGRHWLLRCIFL
ncbi:hypothetical protein CO661_05810 [Sinorhizobium fredii]|uniref:Uncharacterized protein n=1 Tax=Rhizobium fredii TaxID=380 RepID=A0A2A6M3K3_RHIFR|nr:hypothetical protein [Sinorhizobium fredii]MQX08536.1 hypothetical protein [Sinorhizobium fredii]PDT49374.1 hypothetical protein CO661_05810 [Sinorhizobium fredii]UTY49559.1 hypothetical protein EPK84_23745 [Sinorhizobium fredii]